MKFKIAMLAVLICVSQLSLANTPTNTLSNTNDYVKKSIIKDAPHPLGPYSQSSVVDLSKGKLISVAGEVAIDPKTGKLKEDTIQIATKQAMDNITAILKSAGTNWNNVTSVGVFLRDINDWDGMNEVYKTYFSKGNFPPRYAIQSGIKFRVEITCQAFIPTHNA